MTSNDNNIRDKIIRGLELTHKKLIQSKKDRNLYLIVSDNGKIVRIDPKEIK